MRLVTDEGLGYTVLPKRLDADEMLEELVQQASSTGSAKAGAVTSFASKPPGPALQRLNAAAHEIAFPIGGGETVRLQSLSPLTQKAAEALIKQLQLGVDMGLFKDESKTTE